MLKNIIPKRGKVFFNTFNEIVVLIYEAAIELKNMQNSMSQSKEYSEKMGAASIQCNS